MSEQKLGAYIHMDEHVRHQKILKDRIKSLTEQNKRQRERIEQMIEYNKTVFGVVPAEWLGWIAQEAGNEWTS